MRYFYRPYSFLLFIFVLFFLNSGQRIQAQTNFADFRLQVLDSLGKPMSGVLIVMTKEGVETASDTTDSNGLVGFATLEPGEYKIFISKTGYASFTVDSALGLGYNSETQVVIRKWIPTAKVTAKKKKKRRWLGQ